MSYTEAEKRLGASAKQFYLDARKAQPHGFDTGAWIELALHHAQALAAECEKVETLKGLLRCEVTDHPCGTDTVERPCDCPQCTAWAET